MKFLDIPHEQLSSIVQDLVLASSEALVLMCMVCRLHFASLNPSRTGLSILMFHTDSTVQLGNECSLSETLQKVQGPSWRHREEFDINFRELI